LATPYVVALSTCPDAATAERIAHALVEQRLAACVNVLSNLSSVYRWQGKVYQDTEHLLIIKTHRDRLAALEATWRALHPYELPELIVVSIEGGHAPYLSWIHASVSE
jgi:periplasmic divalent cation tolerance protein